MSKAFILRCLNFQVSGGATATCVSPEVERMWDRHPHAVL